MAPSDVLAECFFGFKRNIKHNLPLISLREYISTKNAFLGCRQFGQVCLFVCFDVKSTLSHISELLSNDVGDDGAIFSKECVSTAPLKV